jgi:hypothetical protein
MGYTSIFWKPERCPEDSFLARVSTRDQSLDLQLKALKKVDCQKVFREKVSGVTRHRPELQRMLERHGAHRGMERETGGRMRSCPAAIVVNPLVPVCPSQSLTSVAAMEWLVASWSEKTKLDPAGEFVPKRLERTVARRKKSTHERLQSGNRAQRKELERRFNSSEEPDLEIVHRQAAGIDIGNEVTCGGDAWQGPAPGAGPCSRVWLKTTY